MAYQRFSTADLHPKERLERWIEFGSETLSDMIVVPEDEGGFQASLTRATIGRLGFVWMESTAALATAASKGAGTWAAPTGDAYLLRMQIHGRTIVGNGDETIALRSREMVLRGCDARWSTRVPHHTGIVTVKIPTDVLLTRIPDPDRVVGHVLRGSAGPAGVAASTILAVKQLLEAPLDEPWEDAIADVLLSSLSLACCAARSATPRTNLRAAYHEALWQRARHYIEHHLDDPELSVSKVSRENGIGLRTLQRMFLAMGESPRDYISHRRLERAMSLLQARDRNDRLSITNVAFSVGFNDLSHFSRAFAKRYGRSPRNFAANISDGSASLHQT
jgi:AraC-like DNA-binding protein